MITIINGLKNTLKRLQMPLHFKTLTPKIANKFVKMIAGNIILIIKDKFTSAMDFTL